MSLCFCEKNSVICAYHYTLYYKTNLLAHIFPLVMQQALIQPMSKARHLTAQKGNPLNQKLINGKIWKYWKHAKVRKHFYHSLSLYVKHHIYNETFGVFKWEWNIRPEALLNESASLTLSLVYSTRAAWNFLGSSPIIVMAPGCLPMAALVPTIFSLRLGNKIQIQDWSLHHVHECLPIKKCKICGWVFI